MTVDGNLWARVCFEAAIKDKTENLSIWKNLIDKYSPSTILNDKSTVNYQNIDEFNKGFFPIQASAEALNLTLRGARVFSKINTNAFTENEEILILIQNLQPSQEDFIYSKIKDNIPYCEYLVDSLIKHRQKITNIFDLNLYLAFYR